MPLVIYNLDDDIATFFSGKSATRQQCDQFASKLFGDPIEPVAVQGVCSYTVVAGGHKIIQFREETSLLDMEVLAFAQEVHGEFVAGCRELGWIGQAETSRLAIYEMDRLPGDNYILARSSFMGMVHLQLATVHSLARFVETDRLSRLFCQNQLTE